LSRIGGRLSVFKFEKPHRLIGTGEAIISAKNLRVTFEVQKVSQPSLSTFGFQATS
jgi:hypothetical protein